MEGPGSQTPHCIDSWSYVGNWTRHHNWTYDTAGWTYEAAGQVTQLDMRHSRTRDSRIHSRAGHDPAGQICEPDRWHCWTDDAAEPVTFDDWQQLLNDGVHTDWPPHRVLSVWHVHWRPTSELLCQRQEYTTLNNDELWWLYELLSRWLTIHFPQIL